MRSAIGHRQQPYVAGHHDTAFFPSPEEIGCLLWRLAVEDAIRDIIAEIYPCG